MTKENKIKQAIALKYNVDKEEAPLVIAKGQGLVADEILETAKKNQVHIQEDPALLELLSKLEIHQQIPEELYEAVAEIFAFVYKMESELQEDK
ncbi:EscU/YscU/HrcU family type III secretion system export apparatus switch protein [Metabacillus litoralis]|uniref:EscU/YscU/HrcU family type III secretion system export apparatus switch protein n=1 Tax=Metabacillus litoralis TaxID=152268 RepID=UPI001CFF42FE|nr:EscU/YscU/HrcU family type III secretion system export apparatus switch protein [Metabacillus litoralis]